MPVARKRSVKVTGKVLYLTEAADKLRAQLEGKGVARGCRERSRSSTTSRRTS